MHSALQMEKPPPTQIPQSELGVEGREKIVQGYANTRVTNTDCLPSHTSVLVKLPSAGDAQSLTEQPSHLGISQQKAVSCEDQTWSQGENWQQQMVGTRAGSPAALRWRRPMPGHFQPPTGSRASLQVYGPQP
ncbi:hypothetical protein CB1_000109015 [Camelus ferus]|nr:hypothetical protein CB1_000109015 [Camelus ferus]